MQIHTLHAFICCVMRAIDMHLIFGYLLTYLLTIFTNIKRHHIYMDAITLDCCACYQCESVQKRCPFCSNCNNNNLTTHLLTLYPGQLGKLVPKNTHSLLIFVGTMKNIFS